MQGNVVPIVIADNYDDGHPFRQIGGMAAAA